MAFTPLRMGFIHKMVQNVFYTTMLKRPMAYKSSISLESLYPNSSLKLSTPTFNADPKEKFTGYIPIQKLEITYSASSGPGGQNVNKVHTKVDLRFKLAEADWLQPEVKEKMLELHGKKLSKEGYLIVRSDATRSQQLNVADCLRKLRDMLWEAAATQPAPDPVTQERARQRPLQMDLSRRLVLASGDPKAGAYLAQMLGIAVQRDNAASEIFKFSLHLKAARLRVALKREDAVKRAQRQAPTVLDL